MRHGRIVRHGMGDGYPTGGMKNSFLLFCENIEGKSKGRPLRRSPLCNPSWLGEVPETPKTTESEMG